MLPESNIYEWNRNNRNTDRHNNYEFNISRNKNTNFSRY